jgi:hypothetical protein
MTFEGVHSFNFRVSCDFIGEPCLYLNEIGWHGSLKRDALRIFYETLHEQIPGSEMAEVW